MLRFLISIVLIGITVTTFGQKVKITTDSAKGKFIPTGIRVGLETTGFAKSFIKDDFKEYALQADIDFYRYFLNVGYGQFERTLTSNDGVYHLEGTYLRFGPDINFLQRDPDNSALFFGIRYARTTFSDELTYSYQDSIYSDGSATAFNKNTKADWFEMVAGLKVRIWKLIWLGYTARFKFGIDTFERNPLIPYEIPGYGRADKNVAWDFDYYLIFRIPVRKQPKTIELGR